VTRGRNRSEEGVLATMRLLDAGADLNARMVAEPRAVVPEATSQARLHDFRAVPAEHGADLQAQDTAGHTPLDLARGIGRSGRGAPPRAVPRDGRCAQVTHGRGEGGSAGAPKPPAAETRHILTAPDRREGICASIPRDPVGGMVVRALSLLVLSSVVVFSPRSGLSQELTGTLLGTVTDEQGGVLPRAIGTLISEALIGGLATTTADDRGQLRFLALPPGSYVLQVELPGFATYRETDVLIGAGTTRERTVVLKLSGLVESVIVEGTGPQLEVRESGVETRFGRGYIEAIPGRRYSMFDFIKVAPGVSATSPSSGQSNSLSTFGSGVNENAFLLDGTNFTCPCSGGAVAEPGIDVIEEVQVQSVGASAEFGNIQGAVVNVVTRQGGDTLQLDAAYYGQASALTSQPVRLRCAGCSELETGYERDRYRDLTANLGGPIVRDRAWFFAAYQYLRDHDSQPGTDPLFPRIYENDKVFGKLTWQITPRLRLVSSFHEELWVNPSRPTLAAPFETTTRLSASVPTTTFGHLTHTPSNNTLWDVRVGRFVLSQTNAPATGNRSTPNRFDRLTGLTSGGPAAFGDFTLIRTTAKATLTRYGRAFSGGDHEWKVGGQIERGEHHGLQVVPTGVRFVDDNGRPFQAISRNPSIQGGVFITAGAFVSEALTLGDRLTVNAGLRFDHSRAISPDLPARDLEGQETDAIVRGLGTLYTWNAWSPRLGATLKLTADGRTLLRTSYGRFTQGVLTGELGPFHPGQTPITTRAFDPATNDYTRPVSVVDPSTNLRLDAGMRPPHTDEYSIGVDRQIGPRTAAAVAYVHKEGGTFIGWTDVGGQYREETRALPDGRQVPVFALVSGAASRRFLLTNPEGYSLSYRGVIMSVERRLSRGWQVFGSYTWSRTTGLQPSSGGTAADPQLSSTLGAGTFGRDPNSLTNARGRLPNDRPHMLRGSTSIALPRSGIVLAVSAQHLSGKPWAASTDLTLPQGNQRMLLEPRGSRRLASQTLVDLRVSRSIPCGAAGRLELLLDVLNLLDDTAEEALASDNRFGPNFGLPSVYLDPRRVMLGVRLDLGR
jgi:hypothetical protein